MEIWVDGDVVTPEVCTEPQQLPLPRHQLTHPAQSEFVDDGTEHSFTIGGAQCALVTSSADSKHGKVKSTLYINGVEVPEFRHEDRIIGTPI